MLWSRAGGWESFGETPPLLEGKLSIGIEQVWWSVKRSGQVRSGVLRQCQTLATSIEVPGVLYALTITLVLIEATFARPLERSCHIWFCFLDSALNGKIGTLG